MLLRRFRVPVVPACVLALALHACGGGGGGGGANGQPTTTGSRTPAATRTGSPAATRTGSPATTSAPTLTPAAPTQTPVRPGGNSDDILAALKAAPPGSTVLVAPGTYQALVVQAADLQGPVTLLADVVGASESVGPVIINAVDAQRRSMPAAITISGVTGLTIDGITAQAGTEEGILVLNSPDTVIRNCIARNNHGDGVFVQSSDGSVLFDNLAYQNTGAGIRIYSSNNIDVVNNTLYGNRGTGIVVGTVGEPSAGVLVENNIIDGNLGYGINFEAGNDAAGDYNLNTDGYASGTPAGAHDIDANPFFVSGTSGNFHLVPQLDDCTGGSPAINAGDPSTPADFIAMLEERSTQENGKLDCVGSGCCTTLTASPTPQIVELQPGEVDLGYHYPVPPATSTPVPRSTRTPTKTPTKTPTTTPTP